MLTVIICNEKIIKDCTIKYKTILQPLLNVENVVFCEWKPEGETFEQAVPDLPEVIKRVQNWRALIVFDRDTVRDKEHETINKINPFDFVDADQRPRELTSKDEVMAYRKYVKTSVMLAKKNPLMRLSIWLGGFRPIQRPVLEEEEAVRQCEPLSEQYKKILSEYAMDTPDLESLLARMDRFDAVSNFFVSDGELFHKPRSVMAIAERARDNSAETAAMAWQEHTEFDYSKFAEENMYSHKLRFLVYWLPRIKGKVSEKGYFEFLTTLLIYAANASEYDVLKTGRVYELSTEFDEDQLKLACNEYVYKLRQTLKQIRILKNKESELARRPIDDKKVREEYESHVTIPVEISSEYDEKELLCSVNKIGLSSDCPVDEELSWIDEAHRIRQLFLRFLRQPYRALKSAIVIDVASQKKINDLDAKKMNEFQRDDVELRLEEEEQAMVETETSRVYDRDSYLAEMEKGAAYVRDGIISRLSRSKVIFLGVILLIAIVIGYIPLLISHFFTVQAEMIGASLVLCVLVAAAIGMVLCLLLSRYKLKKRYQKFNEIMAGMHEEIQTSLHGFSKYLSHACNVMREFSILNIMDDPANIQMSIYKKHEIDVLKSIETIQSVFSEKIESDFVPEYPIMPYDYDFELAEDYTYPMLYRGREFSVEFLTKNSFINAPVNFVKSISLRRQGLYD